MLRAQIAVIAGLLLALSLVGTVVAQDEITVEKTVAQVNGEPVDAEPVAVTIGDTLTYDIAVSGATELAGTRVTIRDVVDSNLLEFDEASVAGCTTHPLAGQTAVVCNLVLDDEGAGQISLTFSVVQSPSGGGCQTVTDHVEVEVEGTTVGTAEASVEVCPEGETDGAPSPAPTAGESPAQEVAGETGDGDDEGPNTATGPPEASAGTPAAMLVLAGLALLGSAVLIWIDRLATGSAGRQPLSK